MYRNIDNLPQRIASVLSTDQIEFLIRKCLLFCSHLKNLTVAMNGSGGGNAISFSQYLVKIGLKLKDMKV